MTAVSGWSGLRIGLLIAIILGGLLLARLLIGAFLQLIQLAVIGGIAVLAAYTGYRLWTGWRGSDERSVELPRQR